MNDQVLADHPHIGKIYTVLFKNIRDIYEDSVGLVQVLRSVNEEKKAKEMLVQKELEIMDLNTKMGQVSFSNFHLHHFRWWKQQRKLKPKMGNCRRK